MRYIKLFEQFKLLLENNIHPQRFRSANVTDIIDFVEELLYSNKGVDITEKLAGQHLTVTIKDNKVGVNTKDQLSRGDAPRDANYSSWGRDITAPVINYLNSNTLPDQVWSFEILDPNSNHDYIKYKNLERIYVEYTGKLTEEMAEIIRKDMTYAKLLTKKDIKININKNEAFENFKKMWEGGLKNEFELMKTSYRDNDKIGELKEMLGDLLDQIMVSVVDKVSPIEGIVIGTSVPIKLQTNNFLKVQRVQMPVYSLFKTNRDEIKYLMQEPTTSFYELKEKYNLRLNHIYGNKMQYNLHGTIKYYLQENANLDNVDTDKYKRWLTTEQSNELLRKLTPENAGEIYKEVYNLARS